jgi:hypothetical protein
MTDNSTFELKQETVSAATPIDRRCGTCRWFVFAKGPTGRKRPTMAGACTWRAPWPAEWPESFRETWTSSPQPPHPHAVWDYNGTRCACWKKVTP